ncbi:1-acylglycerol-3-phosphate O-acyltransferase Pnpla3-like isoform X2 [Sitodiplosis mosellana]|uniref:1-acylglycerol-3-phosphate O-acyltransferase Pnpla3-like isoform X2 n=1 Tax=Sitodiplosis mosellana TaxID=263140 RepID=UPI002444494B|nr:1-acylglycerol-3-phosphate O-acyltransferase Pnpla3-like isoform X2 [Sitodiplosis mosellana]
MVCCQFTCEMTSDFFRVVNEARSHSLGPFSPSFNIQTCLLEGLQKFLPPDAHERVNGRLHVSLTRSCDGKNIIVSQFDSREDLLQALLCACFIPGFSGILPPKFQGVRYMDGAFSDNLPVLDENTVTVSPFCGESDICPRDQSAQLFHVNWANTSIELSRQNINRFIRILFPPKPEVLSNMCQQGFDDALQFLHRNNLISCTRCLAVQSTFVVQEAIPEEEFDPECTDCQQHRNAALIGDMPETVLTVFQTYIESANKGLANWMFRGHKGTKILQALSLPATLPADFVCATLTKLVAAAPCIREQFWSLSKYVLSQLNAILKARGHPKISGNLVSIDLANKQKAKHILAHRSSKIDVFHNNQDGTPNVTKDSPDCNSCNSEFNPAYSFELKTNPTQGEVDTFDHILQVTAHHDSVYAYYYMDDNNKVKFTKIVDLTDSSKSGGDQHSEWEPSKTDCTYDKNNVKHHQIHAHVNDNASNNNNNSTNVNNNQKLKRQYTTSEDGPTISEDDLDNLINQSINEWQQRQKNSVDTEKVSIDIDLAQPASIIS